MKHLAFLALAMLAIAAGCKSGADRSAVAVIPKADTDSVASPALPDTLSIALAGDIMMGTTFPDSLAGLYLPPNGGREIFADAAPIFRSCDVACANLEGVFMAPGGTPRPMTNPKTYFIFRMPPEYAGLLVDAGIDFVSIASNHTNDLTDGGRESTCRILDSVGVAYAGHKGICESVMLERAGRKVGIAAFGHADNTLHLWEYDDVRRIVSQLDSVADIVIVSFHGGAEGTDYTRVPFGQETYVGENRGNVAEFARLCVDCGADVVYGHGPHVTRGLELYRDRLIAYSLGNFCTPVRLGIGGLCGHAPLVTVNVDSQGRFLSGKIHSMIQRHGLGPCIDTAHAVAAQMAALSCADFPASQLQISADGTLSSAQ